MQRRLALALGLILAAPGMQALAQDAAPADDNLNAVLWQQQSVEAEANALQAFRLATLQLDRLLADPHHTAAPAEQTGDFADKPPAIILDVDDTLLNTSRYQAGNVLTGQPFTPSSWTEFVKAKRSTPIPGAVAFTRHAAEQGVKVFYVTNRNMAEKPATLEEMASDGFPMGGNVDTFLAYGQEPDWQSAKGSRRARIAKDYRIVMLLGDNLGDFTDAYRGTPKERQAVFEAADAHWGQDWIVIANPTYGSFESAPYAGRGKLDPEAKRAAKRQSLDVWVPEVGNASSP